jgi:hypothetical protein
MITKDQIKNCEIDTKEIESDISITQKEIDTYNRELSILRENPVENRLSIYLTEGKVSKREEFIKSLSKILEYRKANNL